ncbi:MAG: FadR family transcriptional regulator [Phycisphaerae bacterium]|nr:FadR family transcriptional regulator [Phycisphaerae bacterium]
MTKEHLHNVVVKEIISLIASGTYSDGQRLPAERVLCGQFGVSRGTLRKALSNLASLGAVSIKPNSGIYASSLTLAKLPENVLPPDFDNVSLDDIVLARKTIELAAVELACKRITAAQRKNLAGLIEKMAAAVDDLPEFLKFDTQFHQVLVRAGGNMVLATAFEAIYEYHMFSSVFTSGREEDERLAIEAHRKLLAAVENANAPASRRILSRHLDQLKKYTGKPGKPTPGKGK